MEHKKTLEETIKEAKLSLSEIEQEIGAYSVKKDEGDEGFELFMKLKEQGLSEAERVFILRSIYLSKD